MSDTQAKVKNIADKMRDSGDLLQYQIHQMMAEPDKHCTDLGNARRLVNRFGDHMRYCHETGKWLLWDGKRWETDKSHRVRKLAFEVVHDIYQEAADATSDKQRMELAQWAVQSESANRITAMVSLAQAFVPVGVDELDQHPYLFNIQNGVLDLRSGKLMPHDPAYLITKMAPVKYDRKAKCPTWETFLNRIMDDDTDVIQFLKRFSGYSMTGEVSEHALIFLYGSGANGKSTFLNTLMYLFGDYGQPTDPDLLLSKNGEAHPTGVADLRGARMAVTNEIEDGRRLAENLVKQLTGGDRLKARFMRQDFFSFSPSHKLWMAGNHKPIVRGQDDGIWRRIKMVPFQVTIPPEERDKNLEKSLRGEASGILQWAIEGAVEWYAAGLEIPEKVSAAVAEYRHEQDNLADFLDEMCVFQPSARCQKRKLYTCYQNWCDENGQRAYSRKRLGSTIKERFNVEEARSNGSELWLGIGILEEG